MNLYIIQVKYINYLDEVEISRTVSFGSSRLFM